MSNLRIATLLKNGLSLLETLVSVVLLTIFSLIFVGVNKMQGDQAQLENLSPSEVKQKVLITKSV